MANARNLSDPIALRIPADVLADVERIAETTERSRSWVIVRALKAYLAAEGGEILAVAKGRRQIEQGASHALDHVLDDLDANRAKNAA